MNRFMNWLFTTILALCCAAAAVLVIATPMSVRNQLVFGVVTVVLLFLIARIQSPRARMVMIVLTVISATRYLYWRLTETVVLDGFLESFFSIGLMITEIYAWLVLVLSFFQTARPLERKIVPLPDDISLWPTVDVYIPTYNESLDVVRDTVLAATNLDYPRDRLNIYLLDDGRRPEFGAFASAAGVGYITRNDNKHAKAGNLNNALKQTSGELICIFDCDHITTRVFLQATVGAFLQDSRLALIQAPHHFYSPDPFERNLKGTEEVPHEGSLFYGPIQKGNDYWNAAFFCGSCAVIRRKALDTTNGFAVQTVTEDAHTALKLQRQGWSTAYLGVPLASGLATERLALHIIQRGRWCRGMTQIMRVDNPLFGKGLSLPQRLCYLSAMLHFQFPLARFVFLTAPLVYLLFGLNIIEAAPQQVAAYVLPHLFCVVYTNARLVGRYRYTFWNEIYETVLTFHLLKPSLFTLFDPTKGKFDVTDKGGLLKESFVDFRIIQPHLFALFLMLGGMIWGAIRVYTWQPAQASVLVFNLFWASLSLVFLLAAIAVGNERRQIRENVRIDLRVPVVLHLDDGHTMRSFTRDVSMGGMQVERPESLKNAASVESVEIYHDNESMVFPVIYVKRKGEKSDDDRRTLGYRFDTMSLDARRDLVRVVMGRPDAWLQDDSGHKDRPLHSLKIIFGAIGAFFAADWRYRPKEPGTPPPDGHVGILPSWRLRFLLVLLFVVGVALSMDTISQELEDSPAAVTAAPVDTTEQDNATAAAEAAVPVLQPLPPVRIDDSGRPRFIPDAAETRRTTLDEMGLRDGLRVQGNGARAGITFSLRRDEVAVSSQLELELTYSPLMLEEASYFDVLVNGVEVERLVLNRFNAEGLVHTVNIPPELIIVHNQLEFRLSGETRMACSNLLNEDIWINLAPDSLLQLGTQRIPASRDLSQFPAPFIDEGDLTRVQVPVVIANLQNPDALRAGLIVASHIGAQADYRNVDFPVTTARLPNGNAIVLITEGDEIPGLQLPPIDRPLLLQMAHPINPLYQLLIVAGADTRELLVAANFLALRSNTLTGSLVDAEPLPLPSLSAYDAPRWQNTGELMYLNSLAPDQMSVEDVRSAPRRFSFRLPPDLYVWPGGTIEANLEYRFPEGDWIDRQASRLEVMLNGQFLATLSAENRGPLQEFWRLIGRDAGTVVRSVPLNPELLYGNNEISFYFNMTPVQDEDCTLRLPSAINAGLLSSSHLDMTSADNFATLPNLALFAAGSFPFTQRPDLGGTVLILPEQPSAFQVQAALNLAGRIGGYTGYPVFGLDVQLGLGTDAGLSDSDLLVISDLQGLEGSPLLHNSPFMVMPEGLRLRTLNFMTRAKRWLRADWSTDSYTARVQLNENGHVNGLISFASPLNEARNVVVLAASDQTYLPRMVTALQNEEVNAAVRGDLAIFGQPIEADRQQTLSVTSYSIGPDTGRGSLPWHRELRWQLGQYVIPMLVAMLLVAMVMAGIFFGYLERRVDKRVNPGKHEYED